MREFNKKSLLAMLATVVVGFIIIGGSYVIGQRREEARLAEETALFQEHNQGDQKTDQTASQSGSLDQAVADFEQNRENTTAAKYLAYVNREADQVGVLAVDSLNQTADWLETAVAGLKDKGFDQLAVNKLNYSGMSTADLLASDYAQQVADSQGQLILVPLNLAAEAQAGIDEAGSKANIERIYRQLRLAKPEALPIFVISPSLNNDEDSDAYKDKIAKILDDLNYNYYDMWADFKDQLAADDLNLEDLYSEGGQLTNQGADLWSQLLTTELSETTIDAQHGFKGKNDDLDQLKEAEAKVRDEEARAQAEAEAQAQAQAAAQSEAAAESSRRAESEAQAASQSRAQASQAAPAQGQQGNWNANGNQNYQNNQNNQQNNWNANGNQGSYNPANQWQGSGGNQQYGNGNANGNQGNANWGAQSQ